MVTTVATIADTLEEHFLQYYERFMPLLKYLMANAVQKENRLLRGKTIECISLIGLAVGKEKVRGDNVSFLLCCIFLSLSPGVLLKENLVLNFVFALCTECV